MFITYCHTGLPNGKETPLPQLATAAQVADEVDEDEDNEEIDDTWNDPDYPAPADEDEESEEEMEEENGSGEPAKKQKRT